MSAERRQFALGLVFLCVGLVLVALAVSPVVLGLLATPRGHGDVSLPFLGVGVFLAIFGAYLIPSSGAPGAFTAIVVASGPILNRVPGLSRVDDPKPQPPAGGAS
jgi:hypothetical protein